MSDQSPTVLTEPKLSTYWTREEDELLSALFAKGTAIKEISRITGRSVTAIHIRSRKRKLKRDPHLCANSSQSKPFNSGLPCNQRYTKNNNFFSVPSPINAYFAGWIAADGTVSWSNRSVRISLQEDDVELLENFRSLSEYTGRIGFKINYGLGKEPSRQKFLDVYAARQWCEDLHRNFGIVPAKAARLAPPNTTNDLLNWCFILGYFDGDGSISFTDNGGKALSFTSASPRVLEFIKAIFDRHFPVSQGPCANLCHYDSHYVYGAHSYRAIQIFDLMRSLPVPKLRRKWENPEILRVIQLWRDRRPDLFNDGYPHLSFDSSGMLVHHANVEAPEVVASAAA